MCLAPLRLQKGVDYQRRLALGEEPNRQLGGEIHGRDGLYLGG